MWIVCITSVRHVLTVNGYGGRQTKENEKSWCFKGWETLVIIAFKHLSSHLKPMCEYSAHVVLMVRTNGVQPLHRWCGALNTLQKPTEMDSNYG